MVSQWFLISVVDGLMVFICAAAMYLCVIAMARIAGARSFSQMSAFDVAVSFAMGSIIASTLLMKDPPLLQGVIGLGSLFVVQGVVASFRKRSKRFEKTVDHPPRLLMAGREIQWENMRRGQITEDDLWGQLRQANVINIDTIRAVVLETNGEVNVLHSDDPSTELDARLMNHVLGGERLPEVQEYLERHNETPPIQVDAGAQNQNEV